jgi:hypothetical protein
MLLIGLLLAALACIILGVVLASGPWFIASLAASVLAAVQLWRQRERIGAPSSADRPAAAKNQPAERPRQTSLVTGTAFAGKLSSAPSAPDPEVWVVDGKPHYHAQFCDELAGTAAEAVPRSQAIDDGFTECPACTPSAVAAAAQVWVVDGEPDYHLDSCTALAGLAAEPIPRSQAVEDGFHACTRCRPDDAALSALSRTTRAPADDDSAKASTAAAASASSASAATAAATSTAAPDTVWVIDGRPRYHVADCLIIKNQPAEPIPMAQAAEDGFMPCSMCEPPGHG